MVSNDKLPAHHKYLKSRIFPFHSHHPPPAGTEFQQTQSLERKNHAFPKDFPPFSIAYLHSQGSIMPPNSNEVL
jgi:hypothetical protein